MKNHLSFIALTIFSSTMYAQDLIGIHFIGNENDEKSKFEIRILETAAKNNNIAYRWIRDDEADFSDCKYFVNYIANYDAESKHLSITMSFYIGESLDSYESGLSIRTERPDDIGVKMVGELFRIGMANIHLPHDINK